MFPYVSIITVMLLYLWVNLGIMPWRVIEVYSITTGAIWTYSGDDTKRAHRYGI